MGKLLKALIFLVFFVGCGSSEILVDIYKKDGLSSTIGGSSALSFEMPDMSGSLGWPNTQDYTIEITNNGSGTVSSLSFGTTTSAWSVESHTCSADLNVGDKCELTVRFHSLGQGVYADNVTVGFSYTNSTENTLIPLSKSGALGTALSMAKVYPTNGSNWMDYIKNDDQAQSVYAQDDVACDGTELGFYFDECIHGAEKIKFVTPLTDCDGLSGADSLDIFEWTCITDGGFATMVSVGLKDNKGLKDLIDNTGNWRDLQFSLLTNNGTVTAAQSTSSTWWGNTITAAPTNPNEGDGIVTLGTVGTIYYVAGPGTVLTDGIQGVANKTALVVLDGAVLTYAGNTADNCTNWGGNDMRCVVRFDDDFNWFEGTVNSESEGSANAENGVGIWRNARFMVIRNSEAYGGDSVGFRIQGDGGYNRDLIARNNSSEGVVIVSASADFQTHDNITVHDNGDHGFSSQFTSNLRGSRITAYQNTNDGINISYGTNAHMSDLFSYSNGGGGFSSGAFDYSSFSNIYTANNGNHGVAEQNEFVYYYNIKSFNNARSGVYVGGNGNDTQFVKILTANNLEHGFEAAYAEDIHVSHLTSVNNGDEGIEINYCYRFVVNNVVSMNNASDGLYMFSGGDHRIFNFVADYNGDFGISLNSLDASPNEFHRNLLVGTNNGLGTCTTGNSVRGIESGSCTQTGGDGTNTYPGSSSTATFYTTNLGLDTAFIGKLAIEDTTNTSDTLGVATYAATMDWLNFDSVYSVWGIDHLDNFPSNNHIGRCTGPNCQIFNFGLSAAASDIKNRSNDANNLNNPFIANDTCPSAVSGNYFVTDQASTPQTYLLNAIEVFGDSGPKAGDDDGLCEDNETCIYTPNFGYDQGSGNYLTQGICNFVDGTVSGVDMYDYPN